MYLAFKCALRRLFHRRWFYFLRFKGKDILRNKQKKKEDFALKAVHIIASRNGLFVQKNGSNNKLFVQKNGLNYKLFVQKNGKIVAFFARNTISLHVLISIRDVAT